MAPFPNCFSTATTIPFSALIFSASCSIMAFSSSLSLRPGEEARAARGPPCARDSGRRRRGQLRAAIEDPRADGLRDVRRQNCGRAFEIGDRAAPRGGPFRTRARRGTASATAVPRRRAPSSHRAATRSRSRGAREAFVGAETSPASARARWTALVRSTRARTAALVSDAARPWSAATLTGASGTCTSIRSRRGPLRRARYCATRSLEQRQRSVPSPR